MFKRTISTYAFSLVILLISLFLNGCSPKPFLTQDCSYVIVSVSPTGETQSKLIELPWNTNMAIMQKLLLESSFVLSDLHTPSALEAVPKVPLETPPVQTPSTQISFTQTTILQANFPESKRMTFVVDQSNLILDVQSIQIEVTGANVGQVTLNQTLVLQGINNPNLQPALEELINMLDETKKNLEVA